MYQFSLTYVSKTSTSITLRATITDIIIDEYSNWSFFTLTVTSALIATPNPIWVITNNAIPFTNNGESSRSMDIVLPSLLPGRLYHSYFYLKKYFLSSAYLTSQTYGFNETATYGIPGSPPSITEVKPFQTSVLIYFNNSTDGTPPASFYTASYTAKGSNKIVNATASPFTITELDPSTTYSVTIKAYHEWWATSSASIVQSVTTLNAVDQSKKFAFENSSVSAFFTQNISAPLTINNNVPILSYYNGITQSSDGLSNLPLYMFGTRTKVGYQINGTDIGYIFQQDPYDSAKALTSPEAITAWNSWRIDPTNDQFESPIAKWIWIKTTDDFLVSRLIWFYHTFYFDSDRAARCTLYVVADDYMKIYINGAFVSSQSGKFPYVQIQPGLNYIRCIVMNTGGPAGLKLTIIDVNKNILTATNDVNWAFTMSTSSYHSILNNMEYPANTPESGTAAFVE